jgi:hypothetical protein
VDTEATKAFKTHSENQWVAFVDYDLGRDRFAYHDQLSQNIHDGETRWSVWNEGRQYRNDGVDIGSSEDGYYVGWTDSGEWLQYTFQVEESGVYDLQLQTAGEAGLINIEINNDVVAESISLPNSKNWSESTIEGIELLQGEVQIRFNILEGGPHLKAFGFMN